MTDPAATWAFYGRRAELTQLRAILDRNRWFFLQISGRRRIGKTTLIQQALGQGDIARTLYIQIPDSDPVGVIAACNGYLETFAMQERVSNLAELAKLLGKLAEAGKIVALDEFQYFHRKQLGDFCSLLQAEVDRLAAKSSEVKGGLIVLGSLHAEMTALLEDRDAPLFNRTTDRLELGHLDIASILEILRAHADEDPNRLLFLWNLFEGVPKFYRDAFEQGVLGADRADLLRRMFFSSSSPLRGEADNWFLRELRGRYDMILQHLARHPGCTNADIEAAIAQVSRPGEAKQVGGYLKILTERYRMIGRRAAVALLRISRIDRWRDDLGFPARPLSFRKRITNRARWLAVDPSVLGCLAKVDFETALRTFRRGDLDVSERDLSEIDQHDAGRRLGDGNGRFLDKFYGSGGRETGEGKGDEDGFHGEDHLRVPASSAFNRATSSGCSLDTSVFSSGSLFRS